MSYVLFESNRMPFWKVKNAGKTEKGHWFLGVGVGGMNRLAQQVLRATELFCMILDWWIHVPTDLLKPIEGNTKMHS